VYFSEHFQNLINLKILSLRINTLIPPLFPLLKTVLELLQSDSLQCLCRFFPHLLYILETLSFKVPLHSWKQEKITGCQVWGVGGCEAVVIPFFVRNWRTLNAVWAGALYWCRSHSPYRHNSGHFLPTASRNRLSTSR